MAGQQPQTQVHQAPGGQASPGYGWARGFYGSLPGVAQNPYPTYQGQLDPGLSPTMQNVIRMSQGYSQAGPNETLQGAQGSLGRFMTPSFTDPRMRLPMGSPNLFGANPSQKMFNGQTLGSLGQGFSGMQGMNGGGLMNSPMPGMGPQQGGGRMQNPFSGGGGMPPAQPGMGGPQMSGGGQPNSGPPPGFQWGQGGGGGSMQSMTGPGLQAGGQGPQMSFRSGQSPMSFATGGGLQSGPMGGGGGMAPQIDPTSPQGNFGGQMPGGSMAWDMGNQKNRGMVQDGKIWMGGGQGGDSGQWQNYDPNNWGQKQTADLFSRYGSNWAAGAGSGGTGAHSSEMGPWLQNFLGRDPSEQEKMDLYYGVDPRMQEIKQAFTNQSAAFNPGSGSYDPNARYSSAAYRGPGRVAGGGGGAPGQVQGGGQNLAALLSGLNKQRPGRVG